MTAGTNPGTGPLATPGTASGPDSGPAPAPDAATSPPRPPGPPHTPDRPNPPDRPHPPSAPGPPHPPGPDDTPTDALPTASPGRHARPKLTGAEIRRKIRAHVPFAAVMIVVAIAFVRIGQQHWREGTTELGVALLLGSVLRASLTRTAAGLLAIRSRRVDIVTYAVFGLIVIVVALTITGGPLSTR